MSNLSDVQLRRLQNKMAQNTKKSETESVNKNIRSVPAEFEEIARNDSSSIVEDECEANF